MGTSVVGDTSTESITQNGVHIHMKTYLVLASINLAYFAQLITLVGSGLLAQDIQRYFEVSTGSTWFTQAIAIATVALGPPFSQFADLWGRKWIVAVATFCGGIGCIVISRAPSMGAAIAGFVVASLCFGAQSLLHAIVSEVLPRKARPIAQGTINTTAGLGAITGIVMGGALLRERHEEKYRIYFYVNAAIYFAASLGVVLGYSPPPRDLQKTLAIKAKLRQIDWIGYSLFTPGIVLFCIALSWSQNPYPFADGRIVGTFVTGILLIIGFGVYEWKIKSDGVLHHGLFKKRNFGLVLVAMGAEGMTFFAANNYFAFEVSVFTGSDLLISGLHFGLAFFTVLFAATATGICSSWRKSTRIPNFMGFVFLLVFNVCMAATTGFNPGAAFWGFAIFLGVGIGMVLPTLMAIAQLCTPPELISTASALVLSVRSLGGTVGLAINNAIFNSVLKTELPKRIAAATLPLGLPPTSLGQLIGALAAQDQAALSNIPGITPSIIGAAANALVRAYGVAFRYCWIAACCFCVIALIASLFFTDPRAEMNAHIDAPIEEVLIEKHERIEGDRKDNEERSGKPELTEYTK